MGNKVEPFTLTNVRYDFLPLRRQMLVLGEREREILREVLAREDERPYISKGRPWSIFDISERLPEDRVQVLGSGIGSGFHLTEERVR